MTRTRAHTLTIATGLAIAGFTGSAQAASTLHAPDTSECRPVAVQTFHGQRMEAHCRLARIDHGTVPCMTIDTGKPATCRFTSSSGRWLESTSGDMFAMAGQRISRRGARGGSYVVAARLGKDGRPPCVKDSKPKAWLSDSQAAAKSTELAGACVVEVMGSPDNASGYPMDNYATLEVCSSTNQSVDHISSVFTRSPSAGVYCFKGEGAGLNDPNGTERDATNTYLPGSHRCHVVWSNGVEVLAAKRPATTGYPARVDPKTPLLWRPVAQNVRIAN